MPKTGRTHQIRLHLAHLGCPILCDKLYGGRSTISREEIARERADVAEPHIVLERQALHARKIVFEHPADGRTIEVEAPLPKDLQETLDALREFRAL